MANSFDVSGVVLKMHSSDFSGNDSANIVIIERVPKEGIFLF